MIFRDLNYAILVQMQPSKGTVQERREEKEGFSPKHAITISNSEWLTPGEYIICFSPQPGPHVSYRIVSYRIVSPWNRLQACPSNYVQDIIILRISSRLSADSEHEVDSDVIGLPQLCKKLIN